MRIRPAIIATALLTVTAMTGCTADASPASSVDTAPATTSATTAPPASASPTAAAPASALPSTCDELVTPAFAAMVSDNGWTSWTLPRGDVAFDPFDGPLGGAAPGALICRFGADPELATDNILDLAWSPVGSDDQADAQASLAADSFDLVPSSLGVVYATRGEDGTPVDDAGYAAAYLFTDEGVRWANSRAHLEYFALPAAD